MAKHPALLIDDPAENHHYDLHGTLRRWRGGLAAVVTPVPEAGARASDHAAVEYTGKNDSESTRILKNAARRYQVNGRGTGEREFGAAEAADVLRPLVGDGLVVVAFTSYATAPLIVALAHADGFRDSLRVGVSGVRMDTNYNLARKFMVDDLIHYHEHTRALDKLLRNRLVLMLRAHEDRRQAGSA